MKRVLSFLLAAAMTASMASVAFAAGPDVYIDNDSALYYYDSDAGRLMDATGHEFEPGEAIYIQIQGEGVDKSESYRSMHVYADWDVGSNLVESMDIVYKKVNTVTSSEYVVVGTAPAGMANSYKTEEALKTAAVAAFKEGKTAVAANAGYTKDGKYYTEAEALNGYTSNNAELYEAADGTYVTDVTDIDGVAPATGEEWAATGWVDGAEYKGALAGWNWKVVTESTTVYIKAADEEAAKTQAVACSSTQDGEYTVEKTGTGQWLHTNAEGKYDMWAPRDTAVPYAKIGAVGAYTYNGKLYHTAAAAAKAAGYDYRAAGEGYTKGNQYFTKAEAIAAGKYVANAEGYYVADKTFTAGNLETAATAYAEKVAKDNYKLTNATAGKYNYVVEIVTVESTTTRVRDLAGNVRIATTKSKDVPTYKLGVEIKNPKYDDGNPVDSVYIDKDSGEVVKFADDADVIDIEFGEDALFTVNVNGQSELNLGYSTKFNSEFASKYDDANIDFISWGATPSFNRIGDLYIYADEDSYIYEVTADGAKAVANAEYDDDYGAWHIRTRTLKSYAISDMKLKTTTTSSSSSSTSTPSGGGTILLLNPER